MRKALVFAVLCALAVVHAPDTRAADVVVSLKPIHSLVAGVMGEAGKPRLLLGGAASPHTYQMRPSEARALSEAELIVWIGEAMETFLERPIANLGSKAKVVTLHEAAGLRLLPNREGGIWDDDHMEAHVDEHDDHSEAHVDEHDDHSEAHVDEHEDHSEAHVDEHDDHSEAHVDEHEDHGHDHGEFNMHIWLDPSNARRIVDVIADALTRLDPDRAGTYRGNAEVVRDRIAALESSLRNRLAPVRPHAFIVFHDAYQYFEFSFGLNGKGAVSLDPARPPGAKRIAELRAALDEHDVRCMFTEPQFEPGLVRTVAEGAGIRTAALDPLGVEVEPGPDAWFEIMRGLGDAFSECLGRG